MNDRAEQSHAIEVELTGEELRILKALAGSRDACVGQLVREALGVAPVAIRRRGPSAAQAPGISTAGTPNSTSPAPPAAMSPDPALGLPGSEMRAARAAYPGDWRERLGRALQDRVHPRSWPAAPAGSDQRQPSARGL